ncbi:pyridoxamine 5'-phosphate oxidase family protein [Nocardia sp. NRRL S-836]|uniref:pyridoxamine 5'-phosphate oxidase family protein n=1 Tax=Nocardia sp. NRRL S-836 TaxID=1519492 RepID=UPI0006AF6A63|nr:pyridoxamine 5'-phosphate oxidase family protein [Nocardia sp. NRRL S-836]KOV81958.1 pyridoxamine 5-phosphate oxidase [Nocardia sp. NRRL S-836]
MRQHEIDEVLNHPLSQELLARDIARLAFVAQDGTPRNIPVGFCWNGAELVVCTSKNARKLAMLAANPAVAFTIDTEGFPPKILSVRGNVELDPVDDIPEEYLQVAKTMSMTPEQRAEWEVNVRSLYSDGMVRIVLRPAWVKLTDFETTLPDNVAELVQRQAAAQGA